LRNSTRPSGDAQGRDLLREQWHDRRRATLHALRNANVHQRYKSDNRALQIEHRLLLQQSHEIGAVEPERRIRDLLREFLHRRPSRNASERRREAPKDHCEARVEPLQWSVPCGSAVPATATVTGE
jgi:hypothetical protein